MEYAHLGRTGLELNRGGLGTLSFGGQTSETDSFTILYQALEPGINLIDTSNVYSLAHPGRCGGDHRALAGTGDR
jgi:aryl-alcohol dehydrogenase-like predicted oxidoreductase